MQNKINMHGFLAAISDIYFIKLFYIIDFNMQSGYKEDARFKLQAARGNLHLETCNLQLETCNLQLET